ncbi:prolyl 4-hydroxylase subunit alpha-1-like [Tubulanus polymorphus]|uniref:prolyl 4-hydroxylase subunit alpha-1-like n=1 Tax=Tubulanus polymorphus TaxID=672921 RepID=UPI003DA40ED9
MPSAYRIIKEGLVLDPSDEKLQRDLKYFERKISHMEQKENVTIQRNPAFEWTYKYEELCRNDHKKSKYKQTKLKCYKRKTSIPYRTADVEIVNIKPEIAIFHRVISDDEIKRVKSIAKKKLKQSIVVSADGSSMEISDMRVSESGWLADTDNELIQRLSKRIEILTGLSTAILPVASHAEELQVLNYGIGGMYEAHYDFFDETSYKWNVGKQFQDSGNRVATWMFYLSGVKIGGATVFPRAGARVPVVKGAAAFWFNLKPSGAYDYETLHAGCPVLIGSKWVANKWTHEAAQMFRRPCNKNEYMYS